MKKKNFICIFPEGKNIHLIKDVGMVPYMLGKEGYYNTSIAFYEDKKNLPFLENEVKGLNYVKIPRIFKRESINILLFLVLNLSKYDIVMFFHGGKGKLFNALFFKIFSIKKIKFYFKLDMDSAEINTKFDENSIKFKLIKKLNSYVHLLTVETQKMNNFLNRKSIYKTKYLPNGYFEETNLAAELQKENVIITVGRLGTYQKDTETFLRALEKVDLKHWKVKLIGPIAESFKPTVESFYEKNADLKEKVIFTGSITDRKELTREYAKAKAFAFTSRHESFGLVLVEALAQGCYIVSTDLIPAHDITNNGEFGHLFPVGDDKQLAMILQDIIDGKKIFPDIEDTKAFARENFDWKVIAKKLYQYLEN